MKPRTAGYPGPCALGTRLLTAVVLMGWVTMTAEQTAAWIGVIALGGTFAVVAIPAAAKVTPIADPRRIEGGAAVTQERPFTRRSPIAAQLATQYVGPGTEPNVQGSPERYSKWQTRHSGVGIKFTIWRVG